MIPGMADLVQAVQRNCDIADARHAREVTLCTYLLGMREFYRWEHEMPHGVAPARADVGRWISEREALWERIADEDYVPISLGGAAHDPFDAPAINRALSGSGLVYGGGIGRFGKPHFFLGRLARRERRGDAVLLVCDCEYARDISAIPAALQNNTIVVRREALRQWLWERAEGWSVKRQEGHLKHALTAYGFDTDPAAAIERLTDAETETLVLHEEGEYRAGLLLGDAWKAMMARFSRKRPELLARAVRDNLADCLVTLPMLIERRAWASLQLWFANFDGMRRALFPALATAGENVGAGDTAALSAAITQGRDHWLGTARHLMTLDETGIEQLSADIDHCTL
jgi:hypothetical protein